MKESITGYSIANDIRMTRSQYAGCFLVVEGETTDLRVYVRFIDLDSCQIVPAHGKEDALEVLEILEDEGFEGVLAIVDADFWRLEGQQPASPNLFITDAHDLEAMILKSPALEKLLTEFASTGKLKSFTEDRAKKLREVLLELGCPLGYLRWVSKQQGLSLVFEDLTFTRFIDRRTLILDISEMSRVVKNKSSRPDLSEEHLENSIREMEDINGHDPWDICCGHDLVCILSLGLRSALGSNQARDVEPELLQKFLRIAYEAAFFFETQLFHSLTGWESTNQPFRVFPTS